MDNTSYALPCYVCSGKSRPLDKWGGGHPDPEIRGGPSQNFVSALWASVWSNNKGGPRPPGPSPGSATGLFVCVFFFLDQGSV